LAATPQEPRKAPSEEPNVEEPPGTIIVQTHGREIIRPESLEDDGHLQQPSDPNILLPPEPHDAPAEEPNVEEPPAEPTSKVCKPLFLSSPLILFLSEPRWPYRLAYPQIMTRDLGHPEHC